MSLTNASPEEAAKAAKVSSRRLATLPTAARNVALDAVHDALEEARETILAANAKDLELAKQSADNGELSSSILKRLDLGRKGKYDDMLKGIKDVRGLEDPGRPDFPRSCHPYCAYLGHVTLMSHPADFHSRQGGLTDRA
jgi:glutamate-5-semialdehyde dehydrogenase